MITAAKKRRSAGLLIGVCLAIGIGHAQDLRPRAYVITPVHSNAVILSYSFSDECGASTVNPRFCGNSCAAKYNNRVQPKRSPEGSCIVCQKPVRSRQLYCSDCKAKEREERDASSTRIQNNVQSWRSLGGELIEAPLPRVSTDLTLEFESNILGQKLAFEAATRSGALIDALLAVCFSPPSYLAKSDANRYIVLLHHLSEFRVRKIAWQRDSEEVAVHEIALQDLAFAIEEWIFSFFDDKAHPLLPSYALDTALFIEAHANGLWELRTPNVEDSFLAKESQIGERR